MHKALGLIPSTIKRGGRRKEERIGTGGGDKGRV
jgi:hypothetical protein